MSTSCFEIFAVLSDVGGGFVGYNTSLETLHGCFNCAQGVQEVYENLPRKLASAGSIHNFYDIYCLSIPELGSILDIRYFRRKLAHNIGQLFNRVDDHADFL